eukprot:g18123.t1
MCLPTEGGSSEPRADGAASFEELQAGCPPVQRPGSTDWVKTFKRQDKFYYNARRNNLFREVFQKSCVQKHAHEKNWICFLETASRFSPDELYCGERKECSGNCCFANVAKNNAGDAKSLEAAVAEIDREVRRRLRVKCKKDMDADEVIECEGKTYVCAAIAAVLAYRNPGYAVFILTSSSDRAEEGLRETKKFITACSLDGREPILASAAEQFKWGPDGGRDIAGVVYAQVTDVQKFVVDELQRGTRHKQLFDWLSGCCLLIDEVDHVLIEQAANQLYISTPCRSFHAVLPLYFLAMAHLDFKADFFEEKMKDLSSVNDKSSQLVGMLKQIVGEYLGEGSDGHWERIAPSVVDEDAVCAKIAAGALLARFKKDGREFVLEAQRDDCSARHELRVTIVDPATGTESYRTRWTCEAPFVEALCELPMGGSDPLAFFNSVPVLVRMCKWVGGVSGTLGHEACLDFYARVYNVRQVCRIPRNLRTAIYQLPPQLASTTEKHLENIRLSCEKYIANQHGLAIAGPVLVIVESIAEAKDLVAHLLKYGHFKMEKNVEEKWEAVAGSGAARSTFAGVSTRPQALVYSYYRGSHQLPDCLPDGAIVVATNKGGRGLDLKLDGPPPNECHAVNRPVTFAKTEMGSILFVILTKILPERQDVQARGRCGRSGKAGVLQYQILDVESAGTTQTASPSSRVLELQAAADQVEKVDLKKKANNVADMIKDTTKLHDFVDWKPKYVQDWVKELHLDRLPDTQRTLLQPMMTKYLDELCTERWAYWRAKGEPARKSGDGVLHMRERMHFRPTVPLLADRQATPDNPFRSFQQRLLDLACIFRLTAEDIFRLSLELLQVSQESGDRCFADAARQFLELATDKEGKWKLMGDEPWEPEWTGNAGIVLACVSAQIYGRDSRQVFNALQSATRCVEKVLQNLRLEKSPKDKTVMKKMAGDHKHQYPSGVVKQNGKQVREERTMYFVQLEELLRQLEGRLAQLKSAAQDGMILKLQHLSAAVATCSHDLGLQVQMLGKDWVNVVFEYSLQGQPPLLPFVSDSHFDLWAKEYQQKSGGAAHGAQQSTGSGAAGGSAEINREGNTTAQRAWSWILSVWLSIASIGRSGVLFDGNETRSEASTVGTWSKPAESDMNLIQQREVESLAKKFSNSKDTDGASSKLQAEISNDLQGDIAALSDSVYSVEADHARSDLHQTGGYDQVKHDGATTYGGNSRHSAKQQAEEEASKKLFARPEGMSDEDYYLAMGFMSAVRQLVQSGQMPHLAQSWRCFEEALAAYNQQAAAGASAENAAAVNAHFCQIVRKMLDLAKRHTQNAADKKLLLEVLPDFATILENYECATKPSTVRKVCQKVCEAASCCKKAGTKCVAQIAKRAAWAVGWLWEKFTYQFRAKADLRRFSSWGDSEVMRNTSR